MKDTKDLRKLTDFQTWWKDNYYDIFGAGTAENGYWTAEYNAAAIAWAASRAELKKKRNSQISHGG